MLNNDGINIIIWGQTIHSLNEFHSFTTTQRICYLKIPRSFLHNKFSLFTGTFLLAYIYCNVITHSRNKHTRLHFLSVLHFIANFLKDCFTLSISTHTSSPLTFSFHVIFHFSIEILLLRISNLLHIANPVIRFNSYLS